MSENQPAGAAAPPGRGPRGGGRSGGTTARREGGPGGPGGPRGRGGPGGPRGRGGPGGRDGRPRRDKPAPPPWEPKTRLGKMVKKGEIKTMSEALNSGLPLREPEIVDALLPEMEDEVLNINMVQRMTDSGRRVRFAITAVTGNKDGFVGLGQAKGKEVGPTIRRAIDRAKINMIEVRRGAGSWQSGDGAPATSIPYVAFGKCASTEVTIKPAPQGTGLVGGKVAHSVLGLAGVQDAYVATRGQARTTTNNAKALFAALQNQKEMKMTSQQADRTTFVAGPLVHSSVDKQPDVEELEKEAEA